MVGVKCLAGLWVMRWALTVFAVEPVDSNKPADVPASASIQKILTSLEAAAGNIRDYTAVLVKQEHFGGRLLPKITMRVKWARPYKIYLKNTEEPNRNREIIFVEGQNDGQLIAHPGCFPDITVRLDPYGSTAMDENHHPIHKASMLDLVKILQAALKQIQAGQNGQVSWIGDESLWGRPCIKLEISASKSGWYHTAKKGETLWDTARFYDRNMFQILHHNTDKGWKEPDDPSKGDQIFIPEHYGSKILLWIDKKLYLPIKALIYDHDGRLYEYYEHRDLKINTGLTDRDFDANNPDYHF